MVIDDESGQHRARSGNFRSSYIARRVPGVVEGIARPGDDEGGNQGKREALGPKEMGQGAVVVAGGFKSDAASVAAAGQKGSELGEILQGVGHAEVPTAPVRIFANTSL